MIHVGALAGRPAVLADGARVRVRPVTATDAAELQRAFAPLSDLSRYRRSLTGTPRLDDPRADVLSDVDHHDHEALVALTDPDPGVESRRIVGVARFVRSGPASTDADLAVTIADDWHRRGLATELLRLLSVRAREEGVRRFVVDTAAHNHAVTALVSSAGGHLLGPSVGGCERVVAGYIDLDRDLVGPGARDTGDDPHVAGSATG